MDTADMIQEAILKLDNEAVKANCRFGLRLFALDSFAAAFDAVKDS